MKLRSVLYGLLALLMWVVYASPVSADSGDSNFGARASVLENKVFGLLNRLTAVEKLSASNAAQIVALQNTVASLQSTLQSQATTITALQGALAQETSLRIAGDSATTVDAHQYADSKVASILSQAQAYSDGKLAQETTQRIAGDNAAALDAHQYTDTKVTSILTQAQTYTDTKVASILTQAQTYTDGQLAPVSDKLIHFSRSGNDVNITGANVHILSGTGQTYQTINGLGNLIIGYNEVRGDNTDARTGSHNLVLGFGNNYTSAGGILSGAHNSSGSFFSSIIGGTGNTSSGFYSVVVGGFNNTASGNWATVGGGQNKTASNVLDDLP